MGIGSIIDGIIQRVNDIASGTRNILYSNTTSGLAATTVKGAIDELDSRLDSQWTDTATLTNKTIDSLTNTVGADHIHYKVRNSSGSTIAKGTVVKAAGSQPGTDYIVIAPVTANSDVALGVMHTDLANNGVGLVVNTGELTGMSTSAWAVGTILYPNTSGGLTNVRPTSGQYQACAVVLRSHVNQGTLLVEFTEPKLIASTSQMGYVQLNNTLTSTSSTEALTAAQGKVLYDMLTTPIEW